MKRKRLLILLIVLLIVLSCSISAAATETEASIDFNTVDWETVDLRGLDRQLFEWFNTAEPSALFRADGHLDGAYASGWAYTLSERMKTDFAGFIAALSLEDTETQQRIAVMMSRGIYMDGDYVIKRDELPDMVYSVKVSGSKQQYTLGLFKDAVEEYWGIPRTGDRFPVAAIAVCAVSLGFICLLTLDYRRYLIPKKEMKVELSEVE